MENILLSLNGSIIYPDPKTGINIVFLKEFDRLVRKKIAEDKNRRFFIMVGGGYTAKQYKKAASDILKKVPNEDYGWLEVRASRLNAHLLRTIFQDIAVPKIIEHYDNLPKIDKERGRVYICAAEHSGASTDLFSVILAGKLGVKKVFSLIEKKKIESKSFAQKKMSWFDYFQIVKNRQEKNLPFDPAAAKLAQQLKIKVVFLLGEDFVNIERAISEQSFVGVTVYNIDFVPDENE